MLRTKERGGLERRGRTKCKSLEADNCGDPFKYFPIEFRKIFLSLDGSSKDGSLVSARSNNIRLAVNA